MSWEPELEELARRRELGRRMGGPERVARQHAAGRLTVRERIDRLLDPESFLEIGGVAGKGEYAEDGAMTGFTPANCVMGRGAIEGRPVVVSGDDFTIRGGSADASIWEKFKLAERMAFEFRLPLVRLIEGSGGGGSVRTVETRGWANLPGGLGGQSGGLHLCAANLGEVPVVALALGSVAGLGAARLCASHYSVMVKDISAVFVAGPPVVERLGETIDKEQLGGAARQIAAGVVDDVAPDEDTAFRRARRFLSYLPSSVHELPPRGACDDPADRREDRLISIVPRDPMQAYMMRKVVEAVVDRGSFFEMGAGFGRSIITGLARLDGWPVAILAGDPLHLGGAWTADAAQKITRFVDLAETFHLPVVHLVDCPGLRVGSEAETAGTLRHGCRAISALTQSTMPWCSVIVRNVFGVGGGAHQPQNRLALRYAWPSARWGSLPLAGGVEAAYRAELDAAEDPAAKLAEIEARLASLQSPFRTAEAFGVEDIIDPRDTRPLLCDFANLAAPLRTPGRASFVMRP
ncbi:MAG TPA: carboxyl transferase domain-containing protein [Phenylobacterium sp.]|nr:carboxyl transferase domain-containing protein [Phenylobacterium sp.]